jgi:CheY-like chemotaxis protein
VAQSTKTILVADDDKMILEGFKDLFERKGYRVLLAENGELALA